jgi:hypothetical protein
MCVCKKYVINIVRNLSLQQAVETYRVVNCYFTFTFLSVFCAAYRCF